MADQDRISRVRKDLEAALDLEDDLDKSDSVDLIDQRERSATRGVTTRVVVWAYAIAIGLIAVFIIVSSFFHEDFDKAHASLLELLKIGIIPIVTFVIGHYFGSSGR